jgi:hypothetical protein
LGEKIEKGLVRARGEMNDGEREKKRANFY